MKKKNFLLIILGVLVALSSAFAIVASAAQGDVYDYEYIDSGNIENYNPEEVMKNELTGAVLDWKNLKIPDISLSDGPYYFLPGASVSKNNKNLLAFTVFCQGDKMQELYADSARLKFEISLLRQGLTNDKYYEQVAYSIEFNPITKKITVVNALELKQYASSRFAPLLTFQYADGTTKEFEWEKVTPELAQELGYIEGDYYLRLGFEVPSPYVEYKAIFRMQRNPLKFRVERENAILGFIGGTEKTVLYYDDEKTHEYAISSDKRSYYNVLYNMNAANALETQFGEDSEMLEYAQNVLQGEETQVTVSYLENIGENIPFAKKVEKTATVRMWDGAAELNSLDVAIGLGLPSVNALISPCEKFTLNETTGVYEAYYYPGVYLESKTTDGNVMQYILNPNVSYADFYGQFVDDGIITQDLYEFLFADRILNKYTKMQGLTPDKVYGYFGYVLIPDTFTFDQAFAELFDTQLKFKGVVKAFDYEHSISLASYNKLLEDYDYGWLARIWNDVWGALTQCNAKHLVIFADTTETDAFTNMNGSDGIGDTDGLINNTVGSATENVLENVGDFLENPLNGSGGSMFIIVLIAAAIILFIYRDKIFKKA